MIGGAVRAVSALAVLVLAGCSGGDPGNSVDAQGGLDGPLMYWRQPTSDGSEAALIEGTLQLDDECLYLRSDSGPTSQRFPVLWLNGTRWQTDPAGVVFPGGEVVLVGDRVQRGGGYYSPDQLDRFTDSDEVQELAARCVEGDDAVVAVVQ